MRLPEPLRSQVLGALQVTESDALPNFHALLAALKAWQAERSPALARLFAFGSDLPAPISLFRDGSLANPEAGVRASEGGLRFESSGTTAAERAVHALAEATFYDTAALAWGRAHVLSGALPSTWLLLVPNPVEQPTSSLGHMLATFRRASAPAAVHWLGVEQPAASAMQLAKLAEARQPVAVFATAFALADALDALPERVLLAPGSRVMQTGGYKGRRRALSFDELAQRVEARLGPAPLWSEYGMTELASQLYAPDPREGTTLPSGQGINDGARPLPAVRSTAPLEPRYCAPPWVRLSIRNAQTLAVLPPEQEGLIQIDDLANVYGCASILTEDIGMLTAEGTLLLRGRASQSPLRGCSLASETDGGV